MKRFIDSFRKVETQFLGSTLLSALLAAVFSLTYSQDLEPSRRGVISVVFLSSLIFSSVALGGINITFRSHRGSIHPSTHTVAFFHLSILASLLGGLLVMSLTGLYSWAKNPVPVPLILLSGLYTIFVTLTGQLFQILLSKNLVGLLSKLNFCVITAQVATYLALKKLNYFSFAVNVFLAFMFSYFLVICFLLARHTKIELFTGFKSSQRKKIVSLFKASSGNYVFSTLLALTDRVDRILVLVFFSTETLGRYTFLTGLLIFTRFLPDAISSLVVARRLQWIEKHLHINSRVRILLLVILAAIYGLIVQWSLTTFLGEKWRLPIMIAPLFAVSELLRAAYTTKMSFLFSETKSQLPAKSSKLILGLACLIALLLNSTFFLVSVPLGLLIAYLLTFKILNIFPRNKTAKESKE